MWKVTVFLSVVWSVSLLYGEMLSFWVPPLWSCSWPRLPRSDDHDVEMNRVGYLADHMKVAVLADPQLMDKTSHGLAPKSLALEISQFYTDLFMRRSYLASILPFQPDLILFLGDYFDGGPLLSDEEWQESLVRFKHISDLNHRRRNSNIQVHYLSGNHDIGYSGFHSHRPEIISRYEDTFGARNYRFTVGGVEFIAIDAQTLDGPLQGNLTSESWSFLRNVSMEVRSNPKVLLTHIPLYRPDGTHCGPHRSSPVINQRVSRSIYDQGIMYQNYLTEETSSHLLDLIKPVLVLSGHDHDQCSITHQSIYGPVREQTVGTLSWQQGNLYPSFMLLSASTLAFSNTTNLKDAVSTQLCFLPMQTHIYIWYLSLFVSTLLVLLLWPTNGLNFGRHYSCLMEAIRRAISSNNFSSGTKEKNEDENCEYEMIWDAEGSMHLVKKAVKVQFSSSSDMGFVGRGNLAVRPTAKKHISQEIEASIAVDVNSDDRLDATGKLPARSNKSKTKMVIQRLVRTFLLLMVIGAVNVPLYMMLLFKDWIDQ
ncbi:hypothetical protein HHK36_016501 [Tetracentron sinense]|uniref:Calcineurin-like phosphoesterase domain-containing protein n=1 Tax=Tetracentron sinense TaxID=13715 RepID=A0A834Z5D6_TETSI|nr:hypothetical protein HHK36_016501 [Tetracentron sinense]